MLEEIYMYLDEEEDIIIRYIREEHCRVFSEDDKDSSKIHALRWDFYIKYQ